MTKKEALKLVSDNRKVHDFDRYKVIRSVLFDYEDALPMYMHQGKENFIYSIHNMLESLAYSYNGDIA